MPSTLSQGVREPREREESAVEEKGGEDKERD
jgi:hypothetical protein